MWSFQNRTPQGDPVRAKQIATTALVALAVVVGYDSYKARKG